MENALKPQPRNRLSIKEMKEEVLSHFYFEKGILFTFWFMLKRPEELLSIYLDGDRKRVFNPFRYLLIGVAATTIILLNHKGFKEFLNAVQNQNRDGFKILEEKFNIPLWDLFAEAQALYMSYQNIFIVISIPIVGWITLKFFKSAPYNYAEHLVINAFVFGTSYWLSSIVGILSFGISVGDFIAYAGTLITFILSTYLYKRIFKSGIFKSFFGIFLAFIPVYIIGIISQLVLFGILIAFY